VTPVTPGAIHGLIALAVALTLPCVSRSESQRESAAAHRGIMAIARVNFMIVIPRALSLQLGVDAAALAFGTVASNGYTVSLGAIGAGGEQLRRDTILTAAAHRGLEQEGVCTPSRPSERALCTVSMP
jgi:hypothetical protein